MLKGPHIVLAHLVDVHPDAVGTLVPEKDPMSLHVAPLLHFVGAIQRLVGQQPIPVKNIQKVPKVAKSSQK